MISSRRIPTFPFFIICFILILLCFITTKNRKLEYEDYDPEDFYEVTGRVIENRLTHHFPKKRILVYEYFIDKETPLKGKEENINLVLQKGEKFIVLVHKKDSTISFFGHIDLQLRKEFLEKERK